MFTTITCYDRDPPWLTKRVDVFLNKKMRFVKISCKKTVSLRGKLEALPN